MLMEIKHKDSLDSSKGDEHIYIYNVCDMIHIYVFGIPILIINFYLTILLKPKLLKCLILRIILIDHFTLYKGRYTHIS